MNATKIQSLYKQIKKADTVVSVNDNCAITIVSFAAIENHPQNEVIYFEWKDDAGQTYCVKFNEEGLNESFINEMGEICLMDSEGEDFPIRLYENKIIVPTQNW